MIPSALADGSLIRTRLQANLRRLMGRKTNQTELAIESGVSQSSISAVLKGKRGLDFESIEALATALEVDVTELFAAPSDLDRHGSTAGSAGEAPSPDARVLEAERRDREARGALLDIYAVARAALLDLGDLEQADAAQSDEARPRGRDTLTRRRPARAR